MAEGLEGCRDILLFSMVSGQSAPRGSTEYYSVASKGVPVMRVCVGHKFLLV